MHISLKRALTLHPDPAKRAIIMELKQMIEKKVWTPVHRSKLSYDLRHGVIRSSMFLKEKFLPSGAFEKLKARRPTGQDAIHQLVCGNGGDQLGIHYLSPSC
jgi:hypothetical protein